MDALSTERLTISCRRLGKLSSPRTPQPIACESPTTTISGLDSASSLSRNPARFPAYSTTYSRLATRHLCPGMSV